MRPRKSVLLYCEDPDEALELAYALEMRLRVRCEIFSQPRTVRDEYDAALVVRMSGKDASELMVRKLVRRRVNILLDTRIDLDQPSGADVTMVRASRPDLFEQLRILSRRKRGPKTTHSQRMERKLVQHTKAVAA